MIEDARIHYVNVAGRVSPANEGSGGPARPLDASTEAALDSTEAAWAEIRRIRGLRTKVAPPIGACAVVELPSS